MKKEDYIPVQEAIELLFKTYNLLSLEKKIKEVDESQDLPREHVKEKVKKI